MKRMQSGFTLIELIAVIVILGALAAIAIPRFVDQQDEARQAGADGLAGGLAASSATNFANYLADEDFYQVTTCTHAQNVAQQVNLGEYTVATNTNNAGATGDNFTCNVNHNVGSQSATFTAIYISSGASNGATNLGTPPATP